MEKIIQNAFGLIFALDMAMPISIMNLGISIWNNLLVVGLDYLTQTPVDFMAGANTTPYQIVEQFNSVTVSVAIPLTLLFFTWGFFNESINIREEMNAFNAIKMLVRLLVANYFVTHSLSLLQAFIKIFTGMINNTLVSKDSISFTEYKLDSANIDFEVTDLLGSNIFVLIFAIIVCVILVVCGVLVVYNIVLKYLNILILMPFACISFSSMSASNHEFHNMSLSFIKHFLAVCSELVIAFVSIRLVGVIGDNSRETLIQSLMGAITEDADKLSGMSDFFAHGIVYCLFASLTIGLIKGAGSLAQKVFS